jgi:2-polyprenyl-6-methoxyphenol hydroxylase-like FAD-dependent oxidoreductase
VLSLTRPLFEHVVRNRVVAAPRVEVRWGSRVTGLRRDGDRWNVRVADGPDITADLVVDATGRTSRLRRWLAELDVVTPAPLTVDARLGYATQLVAGGPDPQGLPGVVLQATPQRPVGGVALPVEGRRWLVTAVGFGAHRPPRDRTGFEAFVAALPDPAVAAILHSGEAVGDIAVHRQTANQRQRYSRLTQWPDGLLAVGDALCCFDPIYGQGITVSACEALRLRAVLTAGLAAGAARRLLRDFDRIIDFPWAVAVGQDLRMPSTSERQSRAQAAMQAWATELWRRAVQGDRRVHQVLLQTYHLESRPLAMAHPDLIASVVRGRLTRTPLPAPRRPSVLEALTT